jgi:nucleotidyltransferase substrate binding protein (TIGR01987 family)
MQNKISIIALEKAFISLSKAMERANLDLSDLELRDACIQRFEYTYELSNKIIKRFIEEVQPSPEIVDQLTYRDLLRLAAEVGIVESVEAWFRFREARNKTSHAYNEINAQEVFNEIPHFMQHANQLINTIKSKINNL